MMANSSDWLTKSGLPRRDCKPFCTPEENAIRDLVGRIETVGTHPLLTDCINLLHAARERLADWVELGEPIGDDQCGRCMERKKLPEGGYCAECLAQMVPRSQKLDWRTIR